ncbi:DUF3137 domain-containing protein [Blastomonas sp.]|uniref:DUF3137 domain-containing protein n=1 Tax=Blastomonas sp. TaxID=1909299 RepID=UPI003593E7CF
MITIPDVDSLMAGELGGWLAGQTEARKEAKRKAWVRWIGGIVLGAPLTLLLGADSFGTTLIGFSGLIIIMVGFGLGMMVRQKMTETLKAEMNGALAKALDIRYSLKVAEGSEFRLANTFGLLPSYDRRRLEDLWEGEIAGTTFRMYEATLIERQGSGKDARDVTVFRGVILKIHFARDFHGVTLVERQRRRMTLFGDSQTRGGIKLERIRMVDPGFEDVFDVYGNDPVEARYLVHPAYCERLIALETQFKGKKLKALFHKGDVIVTVSAQDMFESGSLNPAQDRARLAKTIEQFRAMAGLIISLNERVRA